MLYSSQHLSVLIERSAEEVYQFASKPENLPSWAAGLAQTSLKKSGDYWIAESPMGTVKVRFVEKNDFGVIDHDVTLPSGEVVHNPLRVLKNGSGSEVVFTIRRLAQVTEEEFLHDVRSVEKDLHKLKSVLEGK